MKKTQIFSSGGMFTVIAAGFLVISLALMASGCRKKTVRRSQTDKGRQATSPDKHTDLGIVASADYKPVVGQYGGRLVLNSLGEPKSFNPITSGETSTSIFTGVMYLGLTQGDAWTNEISPLLAESLDVDDSGCVWTIKLRKDILWSDGQPFSADDVIFTYDTVYDERWVSSMRDIISGPNGERWAVDKIDDYTVQFTLFDRNAVFPQLIAMGIIPRHKYKPLVDSGKFNEELGTNTPPEQFVGTGPFIVSEYQPGQKVVLRRNPYYYKKDAEGNRLPYLDEIVYLITSDMDVRLAKFLNKELDFIGMFTGIRGEDYPVLAPRQDKDGFKLYRQGPYDGSSFIFFNMNAGANPETNKPFVEPYKLKWFTDVRFRRAISHLVDRDFFVRSIYNGLGYAQYGPMVKEGGYFFCNPDIPKFPYDPAKADKLLSEMGLIDRNGDGIREDSDGHDLAFTLVTNTSNTVRIKIAESLRQEMESAGIKVNFRPMDFNAIITKLDSSYDWEACILGLTGGPEPHWGANIWRSRGRMHMWNPKQEKPATRWEAEIDQLFDDGIRELDRNKRQAYYYRHQEIVGQQQPFIYTVTSEVIQGLRSKFKNVFPAPYGGLFHNIEELYILQDAQPLTDSASPEK